MKGFIGAFFAALGILFEENKRWPEMSMVLFPRLLEAWIRNLEKLKYRVSFKFGPHAFLALAMGIISGVYQQDVSIRPFLHTHSLILRALILSRTM